MIVSDAIFALWKNRKEIDINLSLRSYLIKAVRNRCLNYLAQLNKREDVRSHIGDLLEKEQIHYEEQHGYPLSSLIEKELDVKIKNCINNLPALTRRIFCLSRFENLKYEEIAQEVNVSVNVVKISHQICPISFTGRIKRLFTLVSTYFFPFRKINPFFHLP